MVASCPCAVRSDVNDVNDVPEPHLVFGTATAAAARRPVPPSRPRDDSPWATPSC